MVHMIKCEINHCLFEIVLQTQKINDFLMDKQVLSPKVFNYFFLYRIKNNYGDIAQW
jgi:hypothetical protein